MYERIFEYIQIFEYFPPNIDIHIRFVAIFKAEYYSNIRIFSEFDFNKSEFDCSLHRKQMLICAANNLPEKLDRTSLFASKQNH